MNLVPQILKLIEKFDAVNAEVVALRKLVGDLVEQDARIVASLVKRLELIDTRVAMLEKREGFGR